jgi:CheY-like chemotaxis protein
MTVRSLRLLHVEDDKIQQMMMAHQLKRIKDLDFAIICSRSETEAVAAFRAAPPDFVVLDYHLTEGDGLSCLRTLRSLDAIVPIVAVSGQATDAVAAQLLESGADDFISKKDLAGDGLARSVRVALLRADAWRRQQQDQAPSVGEALHRLCKPFASAAGADFLHRLDDFEAAARAAGLTLAQLVPQFEAVCAELTATSPADGPTVARFLRPVLLELHERLAH